MGGVAGEPQEMSESSGKPLEKFDARAVWCCAGIVVSAVRESRDLAMLTRPARASCCEQLRASLEIVSPPPDSSAADIPGRRGKPAVSDHFPPAAIRDPDVGVDVGAVDETLARIERRRGRIGHDLVSSVGTVRAVPRLKITSPPSQRVPTHGVRNLDVMCRLGQAPLAILR